MILDRILLSNFRSYDSADFSFSPQTTVIIGQNTAGKSNLIEAIAILSKGKSFKTDNHLEMMHFGERVVRVKGKMKKDGEETILEYTGVSEEPVFFQHGEEKNLRQQFKVNDIPRRRQDFAHNLHTLLFLPSHMDLLSGGPSHRREFLDEILSMGDPNYFRSHTQYEKALRQRNALLKRVKETGIRDEKEFTYWNDLLIYHGSELQKKREDFILFINQSKKIFLPFEVEYDMSEISKERLEKYAHAEVSSGVTLVGPQRDDMFVYLISQERDSKNSAKSFGSRGQQRLIILNLKMIQMDYLEKLLGIRPILLLDDIFSELDAGHIDDVLELTHKQQTIITTTHKEFVEYFSGRDIEKIELPKPDEVRYIA
jgi:DNA replication and repair protein RecF